MPTSFKRVGFVNVEVTGKTGDGGIDVGE